MGDRFQRGLSYVGFLGLVTYLYGGADVSKHGGRGVLFFIWEILALTVWDIIRVRAGWPAAALIPALAATAVFKTVVIVKAVRAEPTAFGGTAAR